MDRELLHLPVALALGLALGIPPASPLLGFAAIAAAGVLLHLWRGRRGSLTWIVEYVGVAMLSWCLTVTLLHV